MSRFTKVLLSSGPTIAASLLFGQSNITTAATTLSTEATADTFLSSDPANADTDNSGYGAMMISADVTDIPQGKNYARTLYAFVAYNTADIKSKFDALYGANQWEINDVTVKFYSNFSIPGVPANNNQFNIPNPGYFTLSWMSNDSWFKPNSVGTTGKANADFTWNNQNAYLASGNFVSVSPNNGFYWTGGDYNGTTQCGGGNFAPTMPPCFSSLYSLIKTPQLLNDIYNGDYLSLMGKPADSQVVYLINQMTKPDAHPQIFVTADLKPVTQTTTDSSSSPTTTDTTTTTNTGPTSDTPTSTTANTDASTTTSPTSTSDTSTATDTTKNTGITSDTSTSTTSTNTSTDTSTSTSSTSSSDTSTTADTGTSATTDRSTSTSSSAGTTVSCGYKNPQEDLIQNQWLIHAQQSLGFYVTAYDCSGRSVEIQLINPPQGSSLTQSYDSNTGKQKALFTWTPTLAEVEKTKTLKFKAVVKTTKGTKSSTVQQTKISVLPPLLTTVNASSANAAIADASVAKVIISTAQWRARKNQILLQGKIQWEKGITRDARAQAIAEMIQIINVDTGSTLIETQANLAGNWKILIAWSSGIQPPNSVEATFKGKISPFKHFVKLP